MPALKHKGGLVTTFKQKAEVLSNRFFLNTPTDLLNIIDTTFKEHTFPPNHVVLYKVETEEARKALYRLGS